MRRWHHNAGNSDGADEIKRIDFLIILKRRAFDFRQHVDRYTFRCFRQIRQLYQHRRAVAHRLTQT